METEITAIDLGGINCYLLKSGLNFILIDTGFPGKHQRLFDELEKSGCVPGSLKLVIITHAHLDHTGNAFYAREKFGAKIAMHRLDEYIIEIDDLKIKAEYKNTRAKIMSNIFWFFLKPLLKKMVKGFVKFKPDVYLEEGLDLSVYGFEGRIIHIPGHSKGSIGILTNGGDLFCGDILNNRKKPGMLPFADNFNELYKSIEKLKRMNIKTVYPGHGKPFLMKEFLK